MRILNISYLLFLLLTTICQTSAAATYYVDQQNILALDSNAGSEALPWKTIQKAADTLQAGDTVFVKQGTYTELTPGFPESDMKGIKVKNSGTSGHFITFSNYPDHSPVIDQQNSGVGFIISGKNFIRVAGFEIKNIKGATDKSAGIVTTGGCNHIIVENNYIHDIDGTAGSNVAGIRFDSTVNAIARNNRVHTVRVNGALNANASGLTGFSMSDIIVENNEFYDAYHGVYHKQSTGNIGLLVKKNRIHDVVTGLWYDVAGTGDPIHVNQRVTQNIIYNTDNAIWLEASEGDVSDMNDTFLVWNNTLVPKQNGIWTRNTQKISLYNNIIVGPLTKDTLRFRLPTQIDEINYNLYFGTNRFVLNLFAANQQTYTSLSQWRSSEGYDLNSLIDDPEFVDSANHDYQLRASSPARMSGKNAMNMGAYINDSDVIGLLSNPVGPQPNNDVCTPIKGTNGKIALVCL